MDLRVKEYCKGCRTYIMVTDSGSIPASFKNDCFWIQFHYDIPDRLCANCLIKGMCNHACKERKQWTKIRQEYLTKERVKQIRKRRENGEL